MGSRLQAATTRGGSSKLSTAPKTTSGSVAAVSTSGPDITAVSTSGGGGGGGGGADFMLVLMQLVKAGSIVQKGEVVAEFDRQYMMNRLDDFRAGVLQQRLDMKNLVVNLDVVRESYRQAILAAKSNLEKADLDLKTTPVRSAIDAERLRLAREEADAKYKQTLDEAKYREISERSSIRMEELDFQQASLELKRAEANADRMLVKAPLGGLAVMQTIRRGTDIGQIQQGDQLYPGQFFMQVVDLKSMVVNASVNQVDVEKLRIGQKARVRFDAYPDLELPAHVYSIAAMGRPGGMRASYLREVPVRLKLDKPDPRVIPDLSVSVDVVIDSDTQAAAVAPLSSVFRDGAESKPYIFVRTATGFERREVELGLENYVAASIKSGLRPGEVIAAERPVENLPKAGVR